MPEDIVIQHYCDKQHETLDKRLDRIDYRVQWILFFVIITSVGMLGNILLTTSAPSNVTKNVEASVK